MISGRGVSVNAKGRSFGNCLTWENFSIEVKNRLIQKKCKDSSITILALDFDNFNYINDLFGYETGDATLTKVIEHFNNEISGDDIFCNVHSDHFVFLINTDNASVVAQKFLKLANTSAALKTVLPDHYKLVASGGILITNDFTAPLSALVDKANYARKKAKGNVLDTFCIYNDEMRSNLQWQKQLTLMMKSALENHEIEMFLQPKVFFKTGETVGAEALARWNSVSLGMIYPDKFIPIMEQNGFIKQLDFFMLEEACKFLKASKSENRPLLPISINFSKAHIQTDKLVERVFRVVNSYGISTGLIEIEFTENIFSDNIDKLIEIVSDLKLLGFRVSIDDFGSAYSSLNYLKDIPIDIIKIDKTFLDSSTNSNKGRIIIAKVVEMIKSLRMVSVMEGVETSEQVDFLNKLSCDVGQGYFYAKPMPASHYIDYINTNNVLEDFQKHLAQNEDMESSYVYDIPQEFQMDTWELYTLGKNIDMGLMKGYLDGDIRVQYVNDRALEYLGYTRQEFREVFQNSFIAFTHPDDAAIIQENAQTLLSSDKPLSFQTRAIRKDGRVITLQGRSSCVIDNQGRPIGIYAFQDVTDDLEEREALQNSLKNKIQELENALTSKKEAMENLRISEERHRIAMEQSHSILFEWDFATDCIFFSGMYQNLFGENPLTENITTNPDIRARIHPDDIPNFDLWIKSTYRKKGHSSSKFRIQTADKTYLWAETHSTAICDQNDEPTKTIGIFVESAIQH